MANRIRRVCEHKIAISGIIDQGLEICQPDLRSLEKLGLFLKIIIAKHDSVTSSSRNIKHTLPIHPIDPIEAGAIKVNHSCRLPSPIIGYLASHGVIVRIGMQALVILKLGADLRPIFFHALKRRNHIRIGVAQERLLWLKMEKDRATA